MTEPQDRKKLEGLFLIILALFIFFALMDSMEYQSDMIPGYGQQPIEIPAADH